MNAESGVNALSDKSLGFSSESSDSWLFRPWCRIRAALIARAEGNAVRRVNQLERGAIALSEWSGAETSAELHSLKW